MLSTHRFVQHRARAIVALLALAAVSLVLAACGDDGGSGSGSGGGGAESAETLLRQTFTGRHEIRSGTADVRLRVVATGDPSIRGPIELTITGPFQSAGERQVPRFDLALDIRAQGQSFDAGLTSTSDRMFVRFGGTAYEVPAQLLDQLKQSYARQGSRQQMSLESLGLDPMSWLEDPTVEGTEDVGGVETEHVSAGVNVHALLDDVDTLLATFKQQGLAGAAGQDVPSRLPADARQQIKDAVKEATVDVWTGSEDHTLRRLTLRLLVEPPEGEDAPDSLDLTLTVELADLNEPQTIEAPATSRPLSELLGQFQGLLGGALGGANALGDASGEGGASSAQLKAYTRCIQEAGSDVARAQECASLLTQ